MVNVLVNVGCRVCVWIGLVRFRRRRRLVSQGARRERRKCLDPRSHTANSLALHSFVHHHLEHHHLRPAPSSTSRRCHLAPTLVRASQDRKASAHQTPANCAIGQGSATPRRSIALLDFHFAATSLQPPPPPPAIRRLRAARSSTGCAHHHGGQQQQ